MARADSRDPRPLRLQHESLPIGELIALSVRSARAELGWTQAELAAATSACGVPVSKRTVIKAETGDGNLRMSTVEALAKALGTTGVGLLLQGQIEARKVADSDE